MDPTLIATDAHQQEHRQRTPGQPPTEKQLSRVYTELRTLAATMMASERKDHTLQPTALVHEAWLRLKQGDGPSLDDRTQFFRAAAESMRRILIEHARRRKRLKRGGDRQRMPMNLGELAAGEDPGVILAVDEAIQRLAKEDARTADVVRLRFFVGLSVAETAEALDLSERSVHREWSYARARLAQLLDPD